MDDYIQLPSRAEREHCKAKRRPLLTWSLKAAVLAVAVIAGGLLWVM